MEDIQLKFFDFNEPCPKEIVNCENLRKEYNDEIEKYKAQGICNGCIERSLRNKYITVIQASIQPI